MATTTIHQEFHLIMINKYLSFILVGIFSLMLSACGFDTVETGHRGLKVAFGEVVSEPLPEGFYTYNPFTTNMVQMDIRQNRFDDKSESLTKDVQKASIAYTVNYSLESSAVASIYREVGTEWANKLIPQVVASTVKDVVGSYRAEDLVANRATAQETIQSAITANLKPKGVTIYAIELTDIDFTKAFTDSVEAKVVAEQRAIEETKRTVQVQEQAKQTVERAKAEAESIRIRSAALEANPGLVQYEAVQRWNGQLPQYMLGGNSTPFINIK